MGKVMKTLISLVAISLLCGNAWALESVPNWPMLADAIYQAEGGQEGELYGIHSVHYKDAEDARAICIRTCKHKWLEWARNGQKGAFLDYLSKRYCPKHSQRWLSNVKWFYNRFEKQAENAL